MFARVKKDTLEKNQASFAVTRRRLLCIGFSGAVASLGMATSPLAAGPSVPNVDFGPRYSVQNVYQVGRRTHVELEFRVNGRPFRTHLQSTDGRRWRPV